MNEKDVARFRAKIDPNGPMHPYRTELGRCHMWTAEADNDGYGRFWLLGAKHTSHRVAFFLKHGRWPEPCGLHSCDNPPCCNADHIFEGSKADNNSDRDAKCRIANGERHGLAKLTEQDVRDIRANYAMCRVTKAALGSRFGVSTRTIYDVVNRKTWLHIS